MFSDVQVIYQEDDPLPFAPHHRSRRWERQHQEEKVAYRGIDPQFVRAVRRLAADLRVPQGKVACSLLEYALRQYEEGFLDLTPRLDPTRMRRTLYPPARPQRKTPMRTKSSPSWRNITTWRNFFPALKSRISTLASEEALHVPVGELVNALLRYGLQAQQAGLLDLELTEKATPLTLFGEGDA